MKDVIALYTGGVGTGKSYNRGPVFVIKEFRHSSLSLVTTIPLNVELLEKDYPELEGRIHVIGGEDLQALYALSDLNAVLQHIKELKGGDLNGTHIQIDEAHHFLGTDVKNAEITEAGRVLGEIRHVGCSIEFLTQDRSKLHKLILKEMKVEYEIVDGDLGYHPLFGCSWGDLFELYAAWTGIRRRVSLIIKMGYSGNTGKGKRLETKKVILTSRYFKYYNSFSTPHGIEEAGSRQEQIHERGAIKGTLWFLGRNLTAMTWRIIFVVGMIWLCLPRANGSGLVQIMSHLGDKISQIGKVKTDSTNALTKEGGAAENNEAEKETAFAPVQPEIWYIATQQGIKTNEGYIQKNNPYQKTGYLGLGLDHRPRMQPSENPDTPSTDARKEDRQPISDERAVVRDMQ